MKELGKSKTNQNKGEPKEGHLIYKFIRKTDLNLLSSSKTSFFNSRRQKSIQPPLDRIYLRAYNQELFGLPSVFCKLLNISTEV